MDQQLYQQKKPWYKTLAGRLFLLVLLLITVGFLIFASFVGYYVWKIKTGQGAELAAQFNQEFSVDASLNQQNAQIPYQDPTTSIRPNNPRLGNAVSGIKIIAFIDFECPFCQKSYPIFKNVVEKYSPAVDIVFKQFPLASIHPNAIPAAIASACADEQDKFWEYHDLIFENRKADQSSIVSYASQLNLNMAQFQTCLESQKYNFLINQDLQDGISLGVRGTPTYFVNNIKLEGVVSEKKWEETILSQLQ